MGKFFKLNLPQEQRAVTSKTGKVMCTRYAIPGATHAKDMLEVGGEVSDLVTYKEIAEGISVACRVMSRPSRKAWSNCIQLVAWLRDHKKRGMRFRSDYDDHGLVAH